LLAMTKNSNTLPRSNIEEDLKLEAAFQVLDDVPSQRSHCRQGPPAAALSSNGRRLGLWMGSSIQGQQISIRLLHYVLMT
jgi:hypothetical protein